MHGLRDRRSTESAQLPCGGVAPSKHLDEVKRAIARRSTCEEETTDIVSAFKLNHLESVQWKAVRGTQQRYHRTSVNDMQTLTNTGNKKAGWKGETDLPSRRQKCRRRAGCSARGWPGWCSYSEGCPHTLLGNQGRESHLTCLWTLHHNLKHKQGNGVTAKIGESMLLRCLWTLDYNLKHKQGNVVTANTIRYQGRVSRLTCQWTLGHNLKHKQGSVVSANSIWYQGRVSHLMCQWTLGHNLKDKQGSVVSANSIWYQGRVSVNSRPQSERQTGQCRFSKQYLVPRQSITPDMSVNSWPQSERQTGQCRFSKQYLVPRQSITPDVSVNSRPQSERQTGQCHFSKQYLVPRQSITPDMSVNSWPQSERQTGQCRYSNTIRCQGRKSHLMCLWTFHHNLKDKQGSVISANSIWRKSHLVCLWTLPKSDLQIGQCCYSKGGNYTWCVCEHCRSVKHK